jgi:hypothetical protein
MNKRIFLVVLAIVICLYVFVGDGHQRRKVFASESNRTVQLSVDIQNVEKERITELLSSGYDVIAVHPGDAVEIIASIEEYDRLIAEGYQVKVSIPDLEKHLESLYGRSTGLGTLSVYHSYDEMVQELLAINNLYPDITMLQIVGVSIEGRDIYAMKVSDNADINEEEPEVLFTGLHHSREPITVEICLDLLNFLTDNYGTIPQVTDLVDERETWVIPILNPDGYEYAQNVDPWWRKNRRDNGDGTWGVDINRNYGYNWGWDNIGSSNRTSDGTYRGTAPFSEPETQAAGDLSEAHDFSITVTHHSYGDWILYPWGYVYGPTDDEVAFAGIGNELSTLNGYDPGRTSVNLYKVNGDFTDWQYGDTSGKPSNLSFTIETGPEFYPPEPMIPQLIQEGRDHNLYYLSIADAPYQFAPPPPLRIEPMPIDDDGSYTVSWGSPNQGKRDRAIRYELQELTDESIVVDDMEGGSSNWVLDGYSLSSTRSHSGTMSLYSGTGNYYTSSATLLADYKVRMRDELTFWTWYDIEDGYDYAYVEVSTDGGLTFETLAGDITTNSNPHGNNEGNGINGSSNGWVFATFDLSGYLGDHVTVRFRYTTDGGMQGGGFYADDISPVATYGSMNTLSSNITDSSYTVSGRSDGKYYYRVRGIDDEGQWSSWSSIEAMWVAASPYLEVLITPDMKKVIPGGTLGFTVEIINLSVNSETFEVWFDIIMPNGNPLPLNPYIGPLEITQPPGGNLLRHLGITVPENAPVGGPWTLYFRSGNQPAGIISEDSFQFDIVLPPRQ